MKRWIIGFVVGSILAGATPLLAEDVFRIDFGQVKDRDRDLQWRVSQLERAVDQLQRKVFELQFNNPPSRPGSNWTTCFIKTPFDGTFSATEPTETAARARAVERCEQNKKGSIFCEARHLTCGK